MSYAVNFGTMTEDETRQLAIEALSELRLDQRVKAVIEAFANDSDRDELLTWLSDDEREHTKSP